MYHNWYNCRIETRSKQKINYGLSLITISTLAMSTGDLVIIKRTKLDTGGRQP